MNFVVEGNPLPMPRPRVAKDGVYMEERYEAWRDAVGWAAKVEIREPFQGPVMLRLEFYRQDRRRVDLDNLCKLAMDGLNGVAYEDDAQVVELWATKQVDRLNPRLEAWVERRD